MFRLKKLSHIVFTGLALFHGLSSHALANPDNSVQINAFKRSWTANALKLQREIDKDAPLNEATFLATHNSYNAKSYQIPFLRYLDPNQTLSIYEQLEIGVRSIELDAHWTSINLYTKDILLCHALPSHWGCSLYDRPISEGLQEVRDWLQANPNEVVLLYIERHLDGHEPRLAAQLEDYLGEFIFKPSTLGDTANACIALPTALTKATVRAAGKQLLIVSKDCDDNNTIHAEEGRFQQRWNDMVFAGIAEVPNKPFTFLDANMGAFTPFPDCGTSGIFSLDSKHHSVWRTYEDRTILHDTTYPNNKDKIYPETMKELMRCNINWTAMDMLSVDDPRLIAAIWSWAPSYPLEGQGLCAIYKQGVGMQNVPCQQTKMGFACQQDRSREMKAVSFKGTWAEGETVCRTTLDDGWHFAVPVNGKQMNSLKTAMLAVSLQELWLNYAADHHGEWVANGRHRV